MEALDLSLYGDLFIRFLHVFIMGLWIGNGYFHRLIWMQMESVIDRPQKVAVLHPQLLGRALKWSALFSWLTLITGLILYVRMYWWAGDHFGPSGYLFDDEHSLTGRGWWTHIGMALGIAVWAMYNFVSVPIFSKIYASPPNARPPTPSEIRRLQLGGASFNYGAAPALFLMMGASHFSSLNVLLPVSILLGCGLVVLLFKLAPRVKGY